MHSRSRSPGLALAVLVATLLVGVIAFRAAFSGPGEGASTRSGRPSLLGEHSAATGASRDPSAQAALAEAQADGADSQASPGTAKASAEAGATAPVTSAASDRVADVHKRARLRLIERNAEGAWTPLPGLSGHATLWAGDVTSEHEVTTDAAGEFELPWLGEIDSHVQVRVGKRTTSQGLLWVTRRHEFYDGDVLQLPLSKETGSLRVRVLDADRNPVRGAEVSRVQAYRYLLHDEQRLYRSQLFPDAARTDDGGWVTLRAVRPGPHLIRGLTETRSGAKVVVLKRHGQASVEVVLDRDRPTRAVWVTVHAPNAKSGARAKAHLAQSDTWFRLSVGSPQLIEGLPARTTLRVLVDGHARQTTELKAEVARNVTHTITLTPLTEATPCLVDLHGFRLPTSGVFYPKGVLSAHDPVELKPGGELLLNLPKPLPETLHGVVDVFGLPYGWTVGTRTAAGYTFDLLGDQPHELAFTHKGDPVDPLSLHVTSGSAGWEGVTDPTGRFRIPAPPGSDVTIVAELKSGIRTWTLKTQGRSTHLDLADAQPAADAPQRITGRVVDAQGSPLEGVRVFAPLLVAPPPGHAASVPETTTDAEGEFALATSGSKRVGFERFDRGVLELPLPEDARPLRVVLPQGREVYGTVPRTYSARVAYVALRDPGGDEYLLVAAAFGDRYHLGWVDVTSAHELVAFDRAGTELGVFPFATR